MTHRASSYATALLLLCCMHFHVAHAQVNFYSFHPGSTLGLGRGFSPNDLSAAKSKCLDFDADVLENGALRTEFGEVLVTNSSQLKGALGIDAHIDASFLVFSGSGSFNFESNSLFSPYSITLVVRATTEYGRRAMAHEHLTEAASALVRNPTAFEALCGSQVVKIERRGASVAAIITLDGLTSDTLTKIRADMSASGGFGPLSASAKTDLQKEIHNASARGHVQVNVSSTGGAGLGGLGDLVKSLSTQPNSFASIEGALGDYLKQFTADNSAPIGFDVGPMSVYGVAYRDLWTDNQEKASRRNRPTL